MLSFTIPNIDCLIDDITCAFPLDCDKQETELFSIVETFESKISKIVEEYEKEIQSFKESQRC